MPPDRVGGHASVMDTSRWRPPALAAKAALAALLALAVAFPEWDRFADKAMGVRVAAYPAAVMIITLVWALRGRGRPFPWDVDLLVTAPFVVDVAGNAADLYDTIGGFDDACHFGNWALLSAAAGVALRRWAGLRSWTLALTCTGLGAAAAILWEFFEYGVFILDTPETVTIYRDTIGDLMLGLAGSAVAGFALGVRSARSSRPRAGGPGRPSRTSSSCQYTRAWTSGRVISSTKVGAPAMRMPGRTSSGPIPRRAAHWVQSVTRPAARMTPRRSSREVAWGSENSAARPGSANHADSPVSHRETPTPLAAAAAATVNAWLQRSGASAPAVTLMTSGLAM